MRLERELESELVRELLKEFQRELERKLEGEHYRKLKKELERKVKRKPKSGLKENLFVSQGFVLQMSIFFLKASLRAELQPVRIYFDTPTFDRVTKDRAAKFVDMLSAIGGTMGLLTGFSLISGVEILYFLFRLIYRTFYRLFRKGQ